MQPPDALVLSVAAWRRRMDRYILRDPKSGAVIKCSVPEDELAGGDPRAMTAATLEVASWAVPTEATLERFEDAARARRLAWLLWSEDVLTSATGVERHDDAALLSIASEHGPPAPLHYAASLELTHRQMEAATDHRERFVLNDYAWLTISTVQRLAEVGRILPYAERGRKSVEYGRIGGAKGGRPAEKRASLVSWCRLNEPSIRAIAKRKRTRGGVVTWVLDEASADGVECGEKLVASVLTGLLGPVRRKASR